LLGNSNEAGKTNPRIGQLDTLTPPGIIPTLITQI
jgi:hypothetical protein